jgi:hypothetical protein
MGQLRGGSGKRLDGQNVSAAGEVVHGNVRENGRNNDKDVWSRISKKKKSCSH